MFGGTGHDVAARSVRTPVSPRREARGRCRWSCHSLGRGAFLVTGIPVGVPPFALSLDEALDHRVDGAMRDLRSFEQPHVKVLRKRNDKLSHLI